MHFKIFIAWFAVLLFSAFNPSPAFSQSHESRITLSAGSVPVTQVLTEITRQCGYHFSYESSLLKEYPPVTLQLNDKPVEEVLRALFSDKGIRYQVMRNYIILTPDNSPEENDSMIYARLQEVIVNADSLRRQDMMSQPATGQFRLSSRLLNSVPSPGSENDVLKTLQLLPGVSQGSEGKSELYVRGGNGDENLFLLEGIPLYNPNHLFGFFSAFDGNVIESVDFYKGAFPARYGSRLSSVSDMRVKSGDYQKLHGKASIGLISSSVLIQGPLIKEKTSFLLSARRTYLDLIGAPLYKLFSKEENDTDKSSSSYNYNFTDINTKITHRFAPNHTLSLFAYWGDDNFQEGYELENKAGSAEIKERSIENDKRSWGNLLTALNYQFPLSPALSAKATLAYSEYRSKRIRKMEYTEWNEQASRTYATNFTDYTGIRDLTAKIGFNWETGNYNRLDFGTEVIRHLYTPEMNKSRQTEKQEETKIDNFRSSDRIYTTEFSLYAEDELHLADALKIRAGARFTLFKTTRKNYLSIQPRISATYTLNPNLTFCIAYSEMSQYIHKITDEGMFMSSELWIPVSDQLRPMYSRQITGGGYYSFLPGWDLAAEGYYKTLDHVADYKDGTLKQTTLWKNGLTQGKGDAYGMELMIRKNCGKTTGWIGYTLGWSNRWFPNGEVNNGYRFPARYDSRHNINIAVTHRFSERFDISAAWTYHTGARTTVALETFITSESSPGTSDSHHWVNGGQIHYPEHRNNFQLPAYHRLDLSAGFHKKMKRGLSTWSIDLYNAYCRLNTTSVNIYQGSTDGITFYPFIAYNWLLPLIPTFTYSFTF
ncbi:MAG: TonB-dependent receptor plug domain-containing protein [Bacteroidales bacterium]